MTDLPEPMVPAEVDLKDFPFAPMFRARLFGSAFHARASDAEWRAGVTLWLKSWDQSPAGTLPDDDIELCRLAEFGRDMRSWVKVKTMALHGWVKCADGRLHHKVVAEGVLEAWGRKLAQRWRSECARIKKSNQRNKANAPMPTFEEYCKSKAYLRSAYATMPSSGGDVSDDTDDLSLGTDGDVPGDVPGDIGSKGQGQGQGQGTTTHYVRGGDAPDGATTTTPADLISAFDNAIVSVWGEAARRREPHSSDRDTAAEWIEAGITATVAGAALRDRFATMKGRGNRPPFSMSPFTTEIQWAAAGQAENGPGEARSLNDDASRWRSRLIGFRDRGAWFPMYGPKPGEPDCEAPVKLIAEVLPELAPAAQIYHYAPQARVVQ